MTNSSDSFLNPQSIAVYGASERASSPGTHIFRNLSGQGYGGKVIAVNPKYDLLGSQSCVPSQEAAGTGADLAIIAIPPKAVPGALRDCASMGTSAAIIITAGFVEGNGLAGKQRLLNTAKAGNIQIMGPNCLGLVRPHLRLNATFQPALPPEGGLALISQSGAICSSMADMAEQDGLGFSLMMSLGNSFELGLGHAIAMAADDARTKVILVYVEGVRNGPKFRSALRAACKIKPVIVLKAGRHAEGAAAAATHTGALVGSDAVFSAVLREAGAVQVATLGELLDVARFMSSYQRPCGGRLAIVTNGGGVGVLTADRLSDRSLPIAPLPQDVCDSLERQLSPNWSRRNPLDIVGDATASDFKAALDACLQSDEFDAALALLSPQSMTAPDRVADAVLEVHHRYDKPVLSCFLGGHSVSSSRTKLRRHGIPDFNRPEEAVRAFTAAVKAGVRSARVDDVPKLKGTKRTTLTKAVRSLGTLTPGMLSDIASRRLLSVAGIPCPVPELAATDDAAVAIFEKLRSPVVLKVVSPEISHKSEVNGVRLNLQSQPEVTAAFHDICDTAKRIRPDASILGVSVEPMVQPDDAREVLIGVTRDPAFGPVITFGAGGTLVELLGDVATGMLPLSRNAAVELIGRTRVARLLGPFRNMAPVDTGALVDVLVHVSDLCLAMPMLEEMDINPLIVAPSGLCAVDVRIRLGSNDPALRLTGQH